MPLWTGLVFGLYFPIWSTTRMVGVVGQPAADGDGMSGLSEFRGSVVVPWLVAEGVPIPVRTGSDIVMRFPIRSVGLDGCAAGAPAASLRGAGRWLMCCGFAVRPWLLGARWRAPLWTGSVFGSYSPI